MIRVSAEEGFVGMFYFFCVKKTVMKNTSKICGNFVILYDFTIIVFNLGYLSQKRVVFYLKKQILVKGQLLNKFLTTEIVFEMVFSLEMIILIPRNRRNSSSKKISKAFFSS